MTGFLKTMPQVKEVGRAGVQQGQPAAGALGAGRAERFADQRY